MTDADVLAMLTRIERKLDQLLDRREGKLDGGDRVLLAKLLPVVAAAVGSDEFASADLLDYPGPATVLNGASVRRIGRLLQRAEGVTVDGLTVVAMRKERDATIWKLTSA